MADIPGYEIVAQLPGRGGETRFLARPAESKAKPSFLIRRPPAVEADRFLESARIQQRVAESLQSKSRRERNWASVYALGATEDGIAYAVTDQHDRSVDWFIQQAITPTHADLYNLVQSIAAGLQSLKSTAGRAHGNLRPNSILLAGHRTLARSRIMLADPSPDDQPDPAAAEAADLYNLGRLLHELITGRPFEEGVFAFPIPAEPFAALGKHAETWHKLCSALIHPDTSQRIQRLEDLKGWMELLRPSDLHIARVLAIIGLVISMAVGGYFAGHSILNGLNASLYEGLQAECRALADGDAYKHPFRDCDGFFASLPLEKKTPLPADLFDKDGYVSRELRHDPSLEKVKADRSKAKQHLENIDQINARLSTWLQLHTARQTLQDLNQELARGKQGPLYLAMQKVVQGHIVQNQDAKSYIASIDQARREVTQLTQSLATLDSLEASLLTPDEGTTRPTTRPYHMLAEKYRSALKATAQPVASFTALDAVVADAQQALSQMRAFRETCSSLPTAEWWSQDIQTHFDRRLCLTLEGIPPTATLSNFKTRAADIATNLTELRASVDAINNTLDNQKSIQNRLPILVAGAISQENDLAAAAASSTKAKNTVADNWGSFRWATTRPAKTTDGAPITIFGRYIIPRLTDENIGNLSDFAACTKDLAGVATEVEQRFKDLDSTLARIEMRDLGKAVRPSFRACIDALFVDGSLEDLHKALTSLNGLADLEKGIATVEGKMEALLKEGFPKKPAPCFYDATVLTSLRSFGAVEEEMCWLDCRVEGTLREWRELQACIDRLAGQDLEASRAFQSLRAEKLSQKTDSYETMASQMALLTALAGELNAVLDKTVVDWDTYKREKGPEIGPGDKGLKDWLARVKQFRWLTGQEVSELTKPASDAIAKATDPAKSKLQGDLDSLKAKPWIVSRRKELLDALARISKEAEDSKKPSPSDRWAKALAALVGGYQKAADENIRDKFNKAEEAIGKWNVVDNKVEVEAEKARAKVILDSLVALDKWRSGAPATQPAIDQPWRERLGLDEGGLRTRIKVETLGKVDVNALAEIDPDKPLPWDTYTEKYAADWGRLCSRFQACQELESRLRRRNAPAGELSTKSNAELRGMADAKSGFKPEEELCSLADRVLKNAGMNRPELLTTLRSEKDPVVMLEGWERILRPQAFQDFGGVLEILIEMRRGLASIADLTPQRKAEIATLIDQQARKMWAEYILLARKVGDADDEVVKAISAMADWGFAGGPTKRPALSGQETADWIDRLPKDLDWKCCYNIAVYCVKEHARVELDNDKLKAYAEALRGALPVNAQEKFKREIIDEGAAAATMPAGQLGPGKPLELDEAQSSNEVRIYRCPGLVVADSPLQLPPIVFRKSMMGGKGVYLCATEVSVGFFKAVLDALSKDEQKLWDDANKNWLGIVSDERVATWYWNVERSRFEFRDNWCLLAHHAFKGKGDALLCQYYGTGDIPAAANIESARKKHELSRSRKHPMTRITAKGAQDFAKRILCRLPTEAEWKNADERQVNEVVNGTYNLRDKAWAEQQDRILKLGDMPGFGRSPESAYADAFGAGDDPAAQEKGSNPLKAVGVWNKGCSNEKVRATGPENEPTDGECYSDGLIWFAEVDEKIDQRDLDFFHLRGNVWEFVTRTGPDDFAVAGGSALSHRALGLGIQGIRGNPRSNWSDVGFRLAFDAPTGGMIAKGGKIRDRITEANYEYAAQTDSPQTRPSSQRTNTERR